MDVDPDGLTAYCLTVPGCPESRHVTLGPSGAAEVGFVHV